MGLGFPVPYYIYYLRVSAATMKNLIICIYAMFILCVTSASGQTVDTHIMSYDKLNNHSYVALKTNFLYDAVLVPNLGLELNIYKNFTIYGDLMYAGWNLPTKHIYWDLFGAQGGIRKYFGRASNERSFSGHHAGVYCQALAYDLQAGFIGQQTPTINIGVGIEYGYSFPVALGFNIDLDLGVGYLTGTYYEYDIKDEHYTWRGTIHRNWFGPTKASVSLVWLIKSKKNINRNER